MLFDTCSMNGPLWREGEMQYGNSRREQRASPAHAREITSRWRWAPQMSRVWPLSCNSDRGCQLVGRRFAKVQKALIQPFPPVLKRSCLAVLLVVYARLSWEQGRNLLWGSLLGVSLIQWSCRCLDPRC